MGYKIIIPKIDTVLLSPNPVVINQIVSVLATVTEEMMELYPAQVYAGTIYAGEVW